MTFKEKAIRELHGAKHDLPGPIREVFENCIRIIEEIPEEQNCGEKTAGLNYEAKCREMEERLLQAQSMLESCQAENRGMWHRIEYLSGFKAAVELLYDAAGQGV